MSSPTPAIVLQPVSESKAPISNDIATQRPNMFIIITSCGTK